MVERMIDREELLMDTPFLRRIRTEGCAEARAEAHAEGGLEARRRSILDVLIVRFDPPASVYQQVERQLETITDDAHLGQLLAAATRTESVAVVRYLTPAESAAAYGAEWHWGAIVLTRR